MSEEGLDRQSYMVSIYEPQSEPGVLFFTFTPKGLNAAEPQTVCGIFLQHLSLYATSLFRRPFKNFSASCVEVQR